MSRYTVRQIYKSMPAMYTGMMRARGMTTQNEYFEGPRFDQPTPEELKNIDHIEHVWKIGDRFYKLADKHYGDPTAWWIIALYNGTPTEGHVRTGNKIYIPQPPKRLMVYYGF